MFRLWNACLAWFGDLPLKKKLYLSFGWSCVFTLTLGAVSMAGLARITTLLDSSIGNVTTDVRAADARRVVSDVDAHVAQIRTVVIGVLGAALLLNLMMAWRLTQLISRPILEASAVLHKLAGRDLTVSAEVQSRDEVGQMCAALNGTVEHWRTILQKLRGSAGDLDSVASQMVEKMNCSTSFSRMQKELTDKALTSTRVLSEKGEEIARFSNESATASRESAESAQSGGRVMGSAAQTMHEIAQASSAIHDLMGKLQGRSQEIGKAVLVIRSISENTNLLALNAAIEAARAGEQGRGFAVVAGEVRRLAESTRTATEEIEQMVRGIQNETESTILAVEASRASIDDGLERTESARQTLAQIIDSSVRTEKLAEDIVGAAGEQSSANREIGQSMAEVAELAAGSLECSEQVAQTGSSVRASATGLTEIVGQFRL